MTLSELNTSTAIPAKSLQLPQRLPLNILTTPTPLKPFWSQPRREPPPNQLLTTQTVPAMFGGLIPPVTLTNTQQPVTIMSSMYLVNISTTTPLADMLTTSPLTPMKNGGISTYSEINGVSILWVTPGQWMLNQRFSTLTLMVPPQDTCLENNESKSRVLYIS